MRIDIHGINWERLRNPSEHLRVLVPTIEQLADLSIKFTETPMFLPDEHRNPAWVDLLVVSMFNGPQLNWVYEIGQWDGILSFQDIWPGYKADVGFYLWNNRFTEGAKAERVGLRGKLCWGADFIRELIDVTNLMMDEFQLKRLSLASPDEHTVKISKLVGFHVEGRQKYGFRHEGKTFTQYLLRKIREGRQQCHHQQYQPLQQASV